MSMAEKIKLKLRKQLEHATSKDADLAHTFTSQKSSSQKLVRSTASKLDKSTSQNHNSSHERGSRETCREQGQQKTKAKFPALGCGNSGTWGRDGMADIGEMMRGDEASLLGMNGAQYRQRVGK
jgi:hypothetical protein